MVSAIKIEGVLDESAIRHIVREAAGAPGTDPKVALVSASLFHLASDYATRVVTPAVRDALDMADAMEGDKGEAIATVLANLHQQAKGAKTFADYFGDMTNIEGACYALTRDAAMTLAPLPMNRGKWLAKLGILAEHIKAIGTLGEALTVPTDVTEAPATVAQLFAPPAAPAEVNTLKAWSDIIVKPAEIEKPEITDPDMRDMLGLDPLPEVTAAPAAPLALSAEAGTASAAVAPTNPAPPGAPAAATDAPPPPEPADLSAAYVLLRDATTLDDAELAKRLGVSRSTLHNYLSGRTAKVKCSFEQARLMAAEIDVRGAKLRQAAEIFAKVRP